MASSTVPLMSAIHSQYADDVVLHDATGLVKYKFKPVLVSIDRQHFAICSLDKGEKKLLQYDSQALIGMKYKLAQWKNKSFYSAQFILYPVKTGCGYKPNKEKHRSKAVVRVLFDTLDERILQTWASKIQHFVANLAYPDLESGLIPQLQRKVLVFVNPKSGKGSAIKIWKAIVEPMLVEANLDITLIITQYANHAREYVLDKLDSSVESVVVVGGDGLLFEVVNGLCARPDKDSLLASVSLVPIPGGTGNGLSKSLMYHSKEAGSALNATYLAIKGSLFPLDLSLVTTQSSATFHSFLSLSWGVIADVDILSESMRYLGELRLYLAAVYFVLRRQLYTGVVRLKLSTRPVNMDSKSFPVEKINLLKDGEKAGEGAGEGEWVEIEGKFSMVFIIQTSHVSNSVLSGPGKPLNDSVFTVYIVQEVSRMQLLSLMLAMDSGDFVHHPKVRLFHATEYEIAPNTKGEKGIFSLDGEVVEYGKLHGEVLPGVARVRVT